MVEKLQLNSKKQDNGDDSFDYLLAMDTTEQQLHNTQTYHKILEKSYSSGIIEDTIFSDGMEIYFPT